MAEMYVIGDARAGVLFVKTNPLRVALVPMDKVLEYAKAESSDREAIKKALGKLAGLVGVGAPTAEQADDPRHTLKEADFCFIADLEDMHWKSRRLRCPPIDQPLEIEKHDGEGATSITPEPEQKDVPLAA